MKTSRSSNQKARAAGSVLVISMTILAIAALVLGSYLVLVQTQTNSVARSQCWNSAIAVTEAGLEEGMAEVNRNSPIVGSNTIVPNSWAWTNTLTSDGWTAYNGYTTITRQIPGPAAGSNQYTVTISNNPTDGTPMITSSGIVAFTSASWFLSSIPQPFIAGAGASTTTASTNYIIGRKVQVKTVLIPLFSVAILSRSNINFNGNNVTVDSFDSSNTNYSTNGQWVASKRKANGSIATDSSVVGDISVGNANIYGHVYTGPGTAESAVQVGPNGAVGDTNWVANGSGIETNYWVGNFDQPIQPVLAPAVGTALPAANTNGQWKGDIVLNGGNYTVSASSAPSAPLVISSPNTVLWVQGSFSPNNIIFTNGGSLTLYVGTTSTNSSDSLTLGGNGNVNSPGYANNLLILGLPSLGSISLAGNAAMIASIYAPNADFSGSGGGNNNNDSAGSLVVNSITLNGHWNFHYDENLQNNGASRGWIAKNWTEVKY